jgi:hypothetical protein
LLTEYELKNILSHPSPLEVYLGFALERRSRESPSTPTETLVLQIQRCSNSRWNTAFKRGSLHLGIAALPPLIPADSTLIFYLHGWLCFAHRKSSHHNFKLARTLFSAPSTWRTSGKYRARKSWAGAKGSSWGRDTPSCTPHSLWFIIRVLSRLFQGLPASQLEVASAVILVHMCLWILCSVLHITDQITDSHRSHIQPVLTSRKSGTVSAKNQSIICKCFGISERVWQLR